jgi:hypothetical protein
MKEIFIHKLDCTGDVAYADQMAATVRYFDMENVIYSCFVGFIAVNGTTAAKFTYPIPKEV